MKSQLFLLFSFFLSLSLAAQNVTIPDVNFKNKLLQANTGIQIAKNLSGQWFKIDANSDGQIQTSEAQQVAALYVNFSNITNMTGISSFTSLKVLSCFNNSITQLDVTALSQLEELYCYDNSMNSLAVVGTVLKRLDCFNNNITALNLSGLTTLEYLDCKYTRIATLNASNLINLQTIRFGGAILSQGYLQTLNISGCTGLTYVDYFEEPELLNLNISGCTGLTNFSFNNCYQLQTFNLSGCTNLTNLNFNNTGLTTLNLSGLYNLNYLRCSSSLLTSLNVSGLTNLSSIDCQYNQLTNLDLNGLTNLTTVDCSNNQLQSLSLAGLVNLNFLTCNNNQLLSLDISECISIASVDCSNNQLLSIFMKNGKLEGSGQFGNNAVDITNNPILLYICADEGEISGMQTQVNQLGYINCQINSYCSFSPGGVFYEIQGISKLDSNANGCDVLDPAYPNLKFNVNSNTVSGTILADNSGNYKLPVVAGLHTVTPVVENPTYFDISPSSFQADFPTMGSPITQNICITPNGSHQDIEVVIFSLEPPRPGFNVKYNITYKNKGNQAVSGQVALNFQDDVMDLVSSTQTVSSQSTNSLIWDYANLQPFETRSIDFVMNLNTPMETPPLNGNDNLLFSASISPTLNDETVADNQSTLNQWVLNSFDPNDKTCLEGDKISPAMVGKYIHYKIRFENTGNFAAQNIVVKDMIDEAMFDVSSLQITKSSHNCFTRIQGNKVEFIFENINLPFDDENNDGYVVFKIKTKPTVALNDVLKNKADIYFDYNFPIQTNETQTLVTNALANQSFDLTHLKAYPNPVHDILNIDDSELVRKVEIFDVDGRLLRTAQLIENKIDVSQLQTGVYFIRLYTDDKMTAIKITKK